jgi:AhpD family alkylhydroperoxidase
MTQRLDQQVVSPDGMRSLGNVYQYVAKSGLPPPLVNLVFLRVSQINSCVYCIAMHSRDLLNSNVAVEKLMLLSAWRETQGLFSDKERAALQWAESVTLISETGAPDADYQVAAAQFNDKELVDLTIAIGLINTYNRLGISFRRTPEAVASV